MIIILFTFEPYVDMLTYGNSLNQWLGFNNVNSVPELCSGFTYRLIIHRKHMRITYVSACACRYEILHH